MSERVFLLDGNYLIYRSYHAMSQAQMRDSSGQPTGAVYGLLRTLLTLFDDYQPDYLICAMDSEEPTFRHEFYEEYKIQRPEMPDELRAQLPKIERLFDVLNIPVVQESGFESDDLIASMADQWSSDDNSLEIVIVSNDKDNFQVVDGSVRILKQKQGLSEVEMLDSDDIEEELGVKPSQIPDYLSLVGDSVDNIPGVEGIGPTYASRLLQEFESVENMLEQTDLIDETVSERLKKSIIESEEQIQDSKNLVVLRRDAPVDIELEEAEVEGLPLEEMIEFCRENNFRSIREEIEDRIDFTPGWDELDVDWSYYQLSDFNPEDPPWGNSAVCGTMFPADRDRKPMESDVIYFPIISEEKGFLFEITVDSSQSEPFKQLLESLIESKFVTFNQKLIQLIAYRLNVEPPSPIAEMDLQIGSYLISPDQDHGLEEVVNRSVGASIPEFDPGWTSEERNEWFVKCTELVRMSLETIMDQLRETDQLEVFRELENPLTRILALMEFNGIKLDGDYLNELSDELSECLQSLKGEAWEQAGEEFNLNSPKQLRRILFEELELPVQGRTDSGKPSTDADTLKALADQHDLPETILEYRQYKKVDSTYLSPLVEAINKDTGRIHTEFNQTIASTGRLSSSNPNLQNIPVREEFGRKVREAFVPSQSNFKLLGADYSQIELRLLAHMSRDENLMESFREGNDVHTRAAADIFDKDPSEIDEGDRRVAKVVNYGIAYGLSSYGLARDLEIDQEEAQDYIDRYFERYPGVRAFLDQTVEKARENGYVETLWGRRRYIPELQSDDFYRRQFAERAAVNAPIQGTAADLMKKAMIELEPKIRELDCRWLLQVHDELVLEANQLELDHVSEIVEETMTGVLDLRVPITISVKTGDNWAEISK